jgi:tetratricopeptide (TPR) repeat protein
MLRFTLLLTGAVVLAAPQAAAQQQPAPAAGEAASSATAAEFDRLYREGLSALDDSRLLAAETAFKAALEIRPTNYLPILGLADVEWRRGNVSGSWAYLRRAMEVGHGTIPPLHAVARFLAARDNADDAIRFYNEIIGLDPQALLPRLELGQLLLTAKGDPVAAEAQYRAALAIAPNHGGAWFSLAHALTAQRRFPEARVAFQRSAQASPELSLPWLGLARLESGLGNAAPALAAYDRALALEPRSLEARTGRGSVLLATGQATAALGEFQAALAIQPTFVPAILGTAQSQQALGRLDAADRTYRQVLERDENNPIALNNLAWLAVERRGNLDEAARWAEAAASALPNDPAVLTTLGWVRRARNELPQAEAALVRAVELQANADRLARLGVVRAAQGKRNEAIADLRRALQADANNAMARQELQRLGVR